MILVDTSVWIDHFRAGSTTLIRLLDDSGVCTHPMVIGELALGSLQNRTVILGLLSDLPGTPMATHDEVLRLVEVRKLFGTGLSIVDVHRLGRGALGSDVRLWTGDHRLSAAAEDLGVAAHV